MAWKNDQVTEGELSRIMEVARKCLGVSGDFVEMGCYKGDTSLVLAELLHRDAMLRQKMRCSLNVHFSTSRSATPSSSPSIRAEKAPSTIVEKPVEKPVKKLWIYDSFEGLPEKSGADESVLGVDFKEGELYVTKREVKERFLRAGLPVPVIRKAWFADLEASDLPERIAFAFLDGDFYESIRDSLKLVAPRMSEGGAMVVHDYSNPALPGVKKAVDEWKETNGLGDFEMILL